MNSNIDTNKNSGSDLKNIKAVVFDSVGVIFSETVLYGPDGEKLRTRSHHDGQGINYLRGAGIHVAWITGEANGFLESLGEKFNNSPSTSSGIFKPVRIFSGQAGKDKKGAILKWLEEIGVQPEQAAFMGDEVSDLPIMKTVGFSAAPASAVTIVRESVNFLCSKRGGDGAVREFCDAILSAQNIDCKNLPTT